METIQSRYLKRDFSFTPATMDRADGQVTIIPHNVLWDILHNQITDKSLMYEYIPVSVTKDHCFIGCTIRDAGGRSVTEFGESTAETLKSSIAKGIPATMAQIRAFDRAAIRYLDFDCAGKVYSDQEIPSSEYTSPALVATPQKKTSKKAAPPVVLPEPEVPTEETVLTTPKSEPEVKENLPATPPEPPKAEEIAKAPPIWQNGKVKETVMNVVSTNSEIIFFDVETTGLKPADDRILELSAKKFAIEGGQLGAQLDELHLYIKPPFAVSPKITELTGITDELLADKPVEEDAFVDIYNFFGEKPQAIGAYNTPFDLNFMAALYQRQEKSFAPVCQVDVLDMARDLVKDVPDHKLQTIAAKCGIQGDEFHTAGFDTDCTVELFKRFLKEYTNSSAVPAVKSETGKIRPVISKVSLFDKGAEVRRIYVTTDKGTLFYNLVTKLWESKDAKMNIIDMEYLEREAWRCVGAEDQSAFEEFKGKWSAAA